ncbi:TylF/MycF/NovP-related O-methyltransferase [Arundinibacter roseus]|uniref:Macrocin O-methyltransferase n=1 Tax=Arundinibacter roseus TaxID=2070510 RepID=A0A4V2X905_9BACT|nr:TylF/MycF/NovP-related O-methyltransferase [Arundinibacter roseus]TDB61795.1 macrocin O-methyltransferase [Arundinibacter roseus]
MDESRKLYRDLLKRSLMDWYGVDQVAYFPLRGKKVKRLLKVARWLGFRDSVLCRYETYTVENRSQGRDVPPNGLTMLGFKRLDNIEFCFDEIIRNNIPGDLIETGVWRGGATIFMKGLLKSVQDTTRTVWVADSFEGLPKPDPRYEADKESHYHLETYLAVPMEKVMLQFARYGLLDNRVQFLKGWFKDTLPHAPIEKLALLRLDGDMYESTMDALVHLYPKLSVGGFILIDDYHSIEFCRKAVEDYRTLHSIKEEILTVDWTGVYWKKVKDIL